MDYKKINIKYYPYTSTLKPKLFLVEGDTNGINNLLCLNKSQKIKTTVSLSKRYANRELHNWFFG